MFPSGVVQWHAALNDFPSILLILSVAFDVVGTATRRESLKAAAFWTLVVGAAGAIAALVTGLLAEDIVEHGGSAHEMLERHELMGKILTAYIVGLAGWRIWRKGTLGPKEYPTYLTMGAVGALFVLWTAHLGGTIVYEHGAGISSDVMQRALRDRSGEHVHAPGEEHESAAAASDTAANPAADSAHTHAPGTPPHRHD